MTIVKDLSFSLGEYQARVAKVRQLMQDRALDALLVHHFPNISYLSGYQSLNTSDYYALVVPIGGEPTLVLWASERSNALLTAWFANTSTYPTRGDPVAVTIDVLHSYGVSKGRIGIELDTGFLSVRNYQRIAEAFPNATLVDSSGLVQQVRVIKSPAEIEYIRQAAQITRLGIRAAVDRTEVNATDQDIATAAYEALIGGGSAYMCAPPVVSAGLLSGVPHSTHRGVVLRLGDTVLLEVGACIHRYTAPIMRSVVLGRPNAIVKRMAEAILTTLNDVIEAMVPGRSR